RFWRSLSYSGLHVCSFGKKDERWHQTMSTNKGLLMLTFGVNFVLIALGAYLLVVGLQRSNQIKLDTIKQELAAEREYASKFLLPEKEAKAYLSSIEFLGRYTDLLEEG